MKDRYNEIVKKHTPKEDVLKNALIVFFSGGIFGILSEMLLRFYVILFTKKRSRNYSNYNTNYNIIHINCTRYNGFINY